MEEQEKRPSNRTTPVRAIHYAADSSAEIDSARKAPSPVRKTSSPLPRGNTRSPSPFRTSPRSSQGAKHAPKRGGAQVNANTSASAFSRTSKTYMKGGSVKSTTSPIRLQKPTSRDLEYLNTRYDEGFPDDGGSDAELSQFTSAKVEERGRVDSVQSDDGRGRSSSWDPARNMRHASAAREKTKLLHQHNIQLQLNQHQQKFKEQQNVATRTTEAPSLSQLSDLSLDEVFELERFLSNRKAQLLRERVFSESQEKLVEATDTTRPSGLLSSVIREFDELQIKNSYLVHKDGNDYAPPHSPERCTSGNCILEGVQLPDDGCLHCDDQASIDGKIAPNFKMFATGDIPDGEDELLGGLTYKIPTGNLSRSPGNISFIGSIATKTDPVVKFPAKTSHHKVVHHSLCSPGPTNNGIECISSPRSAFSTRVSQTDAGLIVQAATKRNRNRS